MAEIRDELILEIDQALRQINQIEQSLDRALAPIEIEVDASQAQELESTLREIERIAERATTETQSMALAAGNAEVNFEDLARALNISEDKARQLTDEVLEAQAAANRLEDASRDVARQLGLSDTEAERLTRSLRTADSAAEAIDVTAIRMVGRFDSLRTAAAGIAATFAAIGGIAIFAGIARGVNASVQQFAVLEDSVNAVNVIFGTASETVLAFGESAAQAAGLSESAFNQAVTPIGALLQNFGFDAQQAADASVILVQRAADLASVLGGDVQTALVAVASALRGQSEPLTAYGATISAARVEQFALANGLAATKSEITDAITLQARYGLILEDTARVAGDYAATAGDLANAQRTAAGEASNTATVFGDALAPAFEAVLVQAVPILAFFESLTPALAANAEAASNSAGALTEAVSGFVLGLGAFGDVVGGAGDVLQAFPAVIEDVATAIADGDASFAGFNAQLDQFSQRTANQFIRVASQSIPAAVARGMAPIDAFGQAIAFLGQQDDGLQTIQQAFERLSIQSGITDLQLVQVTNSLISQADALGFNADEVEFLREQVVGLNDTLFGSVEAFRVQRDQLESADSGFTHSAETLARWAAEAEDAQTVGSAALTQLASDTEAQAQRTANAFDLFADAPDKIKESFRSAVNDLREQVENVAGFEANLARLAAEGLDALVAEFRQQGPAAATQVVQALNNLDLAREADQLLQGVAGPAIEGFGEDFVDELVARGLTQTVAEALAATLNSPTVIAAVQAAGNEAALEGVSFYGSGLIEGLDQFNAEDAVTGIVDALKTTGVLEKFREAGAAGAQNYVSGFTGAGGLQEFSPSKVFMDIGERTANAFSLGWDQADLTLRTPTPAITGTVNTGTVGGTAGGAGGVNVTLITNNPTQQDEVSDVARMGQIASSIAASYRSVVPNGM